MHLDYTSCLTDFQGRTIILLLKNVLPEKLISGLELVANIAKPIVLQRNSDNSVGSAIRGKHAAVRFGSIIERGGSGKIRISKDNTLLRDMIEKNQVLWNLIGVIFALLCPNKAQIMLTVPSELRIFGGMFTAAYWNLEPAYRLHRDTKDWRWCCAIAFGDFRSGLLDFPIINTSVDLKKLDLCFFWSKKAFHTVLEADITRQTFILTNHTAVIQRYNAEVLHCEYDHK